MTNDVDHLTVLLGHRYVYFGAMSIWLQEEEALFPLSAGNRASVLLSVFTLQLGTGQLGLQRHWPRGYDLS